MVASIADLLALTKGLPAGVWAAISVRRQVVLAYGADAEAVLTEAKSKGEDSPLILRVLDRAMPMFFPKHSLVKL